MAEYPWPIQLRLVRERDRGPYCLECMSSLVQKWSWKPPFLTRVPGCCVNPDCKVNNPGVSSLEMRERMRERMRIKANCLLVQLCSRSCS